MSTLDRADPRSGRGLGSIDRPKRQFGAAGETNGHPASNGRVAVSMLPRWWSTSRRGIAI